MFAVRTSIGQSRCRRKRNKTLAMCIKGDAGTSSDLAGGLAGLTANSLTNSTDDPIFSSDLNLNNEVFNQQFHSVKTPSTPEI